MNKWIKFKLTLSKGYGYYKIVGKKVFIKVTSDKKK